MGRTYLLPAPACSACEFRGHRGMKVPTSAKLSLESLRDSRPLLKNPGRNGILILFTFGLAVLCCAVSLAQEKAADPTKELSLSALGYRGLSPMSRFTT